MSKMPSFNCSLFLIFCKFSLFYFFTHFETKVKFDQYKKVWVESEEKILGREKYDGSPCKLRPSDSFLCNTTFSMTSCFTAN